MSKKIMIADSEPWSIKLISSLARKKGYEVVVACNGIEAMDRYMNHAPDMVFLDNLLEKVDGFQAARRIRETELGKVTPIVLMSAIYQEGEEIRDLVECYGFNEFIEKPFSEMKIEAALETFLNGTHERRASEAGREVLKPDAPFAVEGEITVSPVSDVLFDLFRNKKTGLLYVSSGEITKVLYIDKGNIAFARSNSNKHKLGAILLKSRKITQRHYERALELQTKDRGRTRLGMILVSMGVLSEETLKSAVHAQILSIVFSLFETCSGRYSFLESNKSPEESLPFDINTLDILMWGVRKMDGIVDFKAHLPSPELKVVRVKEHEKVQAEVGLTYFERQVLGLVEGCKTVGEIVSIGLLAQIPVYRILYALFKIGLLETLRDGQETKAEQTVPAFFKEGGDFSLPARGQLLSVGTVKLLTGLYYAGKTGVLQVEKDGVIRSVYLRNGRILFARSNRKRDRIGYLLLSSGKVSRQEYDKAIEIRSYSPTSRIGTIFVEMEAITLRDLHWIVKFQILRILRSVFELEDGEYAFSEGELPTEEMITLEHSTPDLIMDCVRSMPINAQIRVHLPLMQSQILKAMDDNQIRRHITVTPSEEKLLSLIGPGKRMSQLKGVSFMTPDEMDKVVLGFLCLGILKSIRTDRQSVGGLGDEMHRSADASVQPEESRATPSRQEPADDQGPGMGSGELLSSKIDMMEREIQRLRKLNEELGSKLAQSQGQIDGTRKTTESAPS